MSLCIGTSFSTAQLYYNLATILRFTMHFGGNQCHFVHTTRATVVNLDSDFHYNYSCMYVLHGASTIKLHAV